jgi:hypothetical protein
VQLHKKNSQLEAGNYRPVSILPVVSKFFERAIYQQLIDYFDSIFNGPPESVSLSMLSILIKQNLYAVCVQ